MGGREDRTWIVRGGVETTDRRRGRQRRRSSVRGDDVGVRGDASAPRGEGRVRRRVNRRVRKGSVVGSIPGGDGVRVRRRGKCADGGVRGRVRGGVGRRGGGGGDADAFVRRDDGGARVRRARARRRRRGCHHPRVARGSSRGCDRGATKRTTRHTREPPRGVCGCGEGGDEIDGSRSGPREGIVRAWKRRVVGAVSPRVGPPRVGRDERRRRRGRAEIAPEIVPLAGGGGRVVDARRRVRDSRRRPRRSLERRRRAAPPRRGGRRGRQFRTRPGTVRRVRRARRRGRRRSVLRGLGTRRGGDGRVRGGDRLRVGAGARARESRRGGFRGGGGGRGNARAVGGSRTVGGVAVGSRDDGRRRRGRLRRGRRRDRAPRASIRRRRRSEGTRVENRARLGRLLDVRGGIAGRGGGSREFRTASIASSIGHLFAPRVAVAVAVAAGIAAVAERGARGDSRGDRGGGTRRRRAKRGGGDRHDLRRATRLAPAVAHAPRGERGRRERKFRGCVRRAERAPQPDVLARGESRRRRGSVGPGEHVASPPAVPAGGRGGNRDRCGGQEG